MTKAEIDECMVSLVRGATVTDLASLRGTTHYKLRRELRLHHQAQFDAIMAERSDSEENRNKRDAIAFTWLNAHKGLFLDTIDRHGGPRKSITALADNGYSGNVASAMRWWKAQPEHDAWVKRQWAMFGKANHERERRLHKSGYGFEWSQDPSEKIIDNQRLKPLRTYQDISESEKARITARAKEVLTQGLGRRDYEITARVYA